MTFLVFTLMGHKVPWKTRMLIHLPVASRPFIVLQKKVVTEGRISEAKKPQKIAASILLDGLQGGGRKWGGTPKQRPT